MDCTTMCTTTDTHINDNVVTTANSKNDEVENKTKAGINCERTDMEEENILDDQWDDDIPADERGDPNIVLRNLLSGIRPPDGNSPPTFPQLQQEPVVAHEKIIELEKIAPGEGELDMHDELADEVFVTGTGKMTDNLLEQIDTLINMEHQATHSTRLKKRSLKHNQEKLERLDSKLNSAETEVQSLTPPSSSGSRVCQKSPGCDSGFVEKQVRKNTETKDNCDSSFSNDSDLSSDWSPLSTINSADYSVSSSKFSWPRRVPQNSQLTSTCNNRKTSSLNNKKLSNTSAWLQSCFATSSSSMAYNESELSAIRKFLTLTSKYFNYGASTGLREDMPLDEIAKIPDMNEVIAMQNKEVKDQRALIEGFMHQLGNLLIEVVNLKKEQAAVQSKQAKALMLLKKQLDHHKKNQSQTCNYILEQVNHLNEKLSCTSMTDLETGSVKFSSKLLSDKLASHTNNYGHIIWKIPDVMRKITRIKSGVLDGTLVSKQFQTGEYQYNMNSWVYLNGRGKMVGKYVSVYCCVLVGEYDAILSWPVTPTYKFTLMDQRSDPTKRQDHVRYCRVLDIAGRGENVISKNCGVPRPTDGSKALIVGLDDFIAHDQLLKHRYLVDDIIFLKVEVDVH